MEPAIHAWSCGLLTGYWIDVSQVKIYSSYEILFPEHKKCWSNSILGKVDKVQNTAESMGINYRKWISNPRVQAY